MMATGTRTILLSRWRTGARPAWTWSEFTQELPHTTPADAWQRAVEVVSNSTLNVDAEPRIRKSATEHAESDAGAARHASVFLGRLPAGRFRLPHASRRAEGRTEIGRILAHRAGP